MAAKLITPIRLTAIFIEQLCFNIEHRALKNMVSFQISSLPSSSSIIIIPISKSIIIFRFWALVLGQERTTKLVVHFGLGNPTITSDQYPSCQNCHIMGILLGLSLNRLLGYIRIKNISRIQIYLV